ncbi:MAG: hypothetical protein Q4F65_00970 [Propionibacteriaceae bacterium]|nr:hypothetical protein [Propionibacteriaceae bacterium]
MTDYNELAAGRDRARLTRMLDQVRAYCLRVLDDPSPDEGPVGAVGYYHGRDSVAEHILELIDDKGAPA